MIGLPLRELAKHRLKWITSDGEYFSTAVGLRLEKVYDLGYTTVLDFRVA